MAYTISKACTKCGACLSECPTGSITAGTSRYVIDADTCADHASCVEVCPVDAIQPADGANKPSTPASDAPAAKVRK